MSPCAFFSPSFHPILQGSKRDKDPMITPEMPTRGSVGQTIFRHHPHGHIDHPMSVVSARWSQICQINVEVLFASMTVMRRVGHQEINRVTRAQITQVMQRALSRFVPRGEMRAPGTRSLLMVAMIRHELGGGEAVDVGNPLGGVWYVSSRSVHNGLPEEKGWERQYKSDRLACPDRIQNRCYSVQKPRAMFAVILESVEIPPAPLSPPRRAVG